MKSIRVIFAYFRGIRFQMLLLAVMMTFSLLLAVHAMAKYEYLCVGLDVVSSPRKQDLYYVSRFLTGADRQNLGEIGLANQTNTRIEQLEKMEEVECAYSIWSISGVYFISPEERAMAEKEAIDAVIQGGEWMEPQSPLTSIIFYDSRMLSDFPGLKKLGIQFDETGCLLATKELRERVNDGKIKFYSTVQDDLEAEIPVAGRLSYPYLAMNFGIAKTDLMSSADFLKAQEAVLLEYDKEMIEENLFTKPLPSYNFVLKFSKDASLEAREKILNDLKDVYCIQSMNDIVEKTQALMEEQLYQELPKPLFMLFISTVAFFSTVILTVKEKEKEASILYLCGASRFRVATFCISTFAICAFCPTVINLIYMKVKPILEWYGVVQQTEPILMGNRTMSFVILYFIFTLLIAAGTVFVSMAGKNPIQFLRGAEK